MFKRARDKVTRIYFASDIHGSQKCFNKFINAGKFYEADAIILGGDITGKSILHIEKRTDGSFHSNFMGIDNNFSTTEEADNFAKAVKTAGLYPFFSTLDEWTAYKNDPASMDDLFYRLMRKSLEEWMDIAETKLKNSGIKCFIMPGNDDPFSIDEILKQSDYIINPDASVVQVDDFLTMASCGFSNPTPWDSPRECSESDLKDKIELVMQNVPDPKTCILLAHVPPYNSTLDDAPRLSSTLQVQSSGGVVEVAPVGSTAVLEAIQKYGYILSLHGHIHEVHAIKTIGKTLSINPGSDYGDGILHGALVNVSNNYIKSYQLVAG